MIASTFLFVILVVSTMHFTSVNAFTTPAYSSSANYKRTTTAVSLVPTPSDFADASSLLLVKYDTKMLGMKMFVKESGGAATAVLKTKTDVAAQVLNDGSHALLDFPSIFNTNTNKKQSKLRMRYAQVAGRLMVLGIGLLPNHGFHAEEIAVQLFLLAVSMKPVIRSIQLYQCLSSAQCVEECELELDDLEQSLP
jgi:hypothetical protein